MRPHYYSLNEYLKDTLGEKLYKLSLNGGMSCPNRDGSIDTRGCIFCSAGGSGDFAGDAVGRTAGSNLAKADYPLTIPEQLESAKRLISGKYHGSSYIAYFQAYTNTYADTDYLRKLFYPVITRDDIKVLSIATRPDCLPPDTLDLLKELNQIKPVWVELGLQTIHKSTSDYIRRGYELDTFNTAVDNLATIGINPIVHVIIGLPGETKAMFLDTIRHVAHSGASGIKLQLLHILKGTDLAHDYKMHRFETLSLETYAQYLGEAIELLPTDMVIHRLTGDGPKSLLIAPEWSANKKNVLNIINTFIKENNIIQGRNFR